MLRDLKTVSRFGICIPLRAKMSPTPSLKSFAPIRIRFRDSESASLCEQKCPPHHLSNPQSYRDTTIYVKSADVEKSIILKILSLLRDLKTVSRFGICISLRAKMSPTPSLKSSGLPRYNNLGQISC